MAKTFSALHFVGVKLHLPPPSPFEVPPQVEGGDVPKTRCYFFPFFILAPFSGFCNSNGSSSSIEGSRGLYLDLLL